MSKKNIGRILLLLGAVLLVLLFAWEAFSDELSIVEVRRNIPLSDDGIIYKDYYINAGSSQGLKHHLVVTAIRQVAIKDPTGSQDYGNITVPVGQLKIISVGDKISIARFYKDLSRDDQPMLEQMGIMIGDRLELKGSFVDNSMPTDKKLVEAESPKLELKLQPTPAVPEVHATEEGLAKAAEKPTLPKPAEPALIPVKDPKAEAKAKAKADPAQTKDPLLERSAASEVPLKQATE